MYNIIPFVLILICLAIIIVISARKFSVLASIDVENIPQEKEARVKEQIISSRLKRNFVKWSSKITRALVYLSKKISSLSKFIYRKLHELKENYSITESLNQSNVQDKIKKLLAEAENLKEEENYNEAEKKLIEVIGLDSKNLQAFGNLGKIYIFEKNFGEAKQTLEHLLKLSETAEEGECDYGEIYYNLSLVNQAMENFVEALSNIKKALKIQPNNPRYLDAMLEIGILKKDKSAASEALERLGEANPENNKLEEFKRRIKEL
ncbi:MAG: hypothetical protein PHT51_01165 [Patescibacteria group bacterium]|nr:hypothetical protein [Patescibacteria group bacterium]MDD4610483.1 hypothetical protein [Patescibacteria group bacterium]